MIKKYGLLALSVLILAGAFFVLGVQAQKTFWTPKPVDHVVYMWLPSGFTIA